MIINLTISEIHLNIMLLTQLKIKLKGEFQIFNETNESYKALQCSKKNTCKPDKFLKSKF